MQQDRGMRACNNNKMRNPSLHLFLLHALIPSLAKYTLPSSPVLLHIYCTCFSTFWLCHPYILQHFNGKVFTPFIYLDLHNFELSNQIAER